ncbi:hypothetical protein GCM10023115_05270 [Pontixanthobacter gangjinensis]|uniref:PAS domain-containing protein n=1 Tax=Pontixanthobacter gangjinensis TaxID=1028742 RepID=A0A6I4SK14_9SPHN|nr:hypothetical protein [Pontixanthobacter gangjinensis]
MDTLRGNFGSTDSYDVDDDFDGADDETARELPPTAIGSDERRMQVRAYNHWASLLDDRNFPSIEDLEPADLPDFGPYSVLLDFTSGIEDPAILYLGKELAGECGTDVEISQLSDVPSRSLLSRITDHYMQILANQAPIGFEAEFVNQRSSTIAYRGILLPYSSDGETIDFIYGVINWKELADQITTDELLLEIDQALDATDAESGIEDDEEDSARETDPVTDWADGPSTALPDPVSDIPLSDSIHLEDANDDAFPAPAFGTGELAEANEAAADYDSEYDENEEDEEDEYEYDECEGDEYEAGTIEDDDNAVVARLASLIQPRGMAKPSAADQDQDFSAEDGDWEMNLPSNPLLRSVDQIVEDNRRAAAAGPSADEAPTEIEPIIEVSAELDPEAGLHDCLAEARELAQAARTSEDRTRANLYAAVGRAYDVSLAAQESPEEFEELIAENGLTIQERAPMTPVVKLVFGADYDKTRLTEYASVLSHAQRVGIERGQLSAFLSKAEGGLKAVVQTERRIRKEESGQQVEPTDAPRASIAKKLRELEGQSLDSINPQGAEFGVVLIRRLENGEIVMLGEVSDDIPLVERVARKVLL